MMLPRGQRLVFERPTNSEAIAAFNQWLSDPVMMVYMGGALSSDERLAYFEFMTRHWMEHGFGHYLLRSIETSAPVGFASFKYLSGRPDAELPFPDLGFAVSLNYRGRGLATEAAWALVRFGAEVVRVAPIWAHVDRENRASVRVLQKVGFAYTADVRLHYLGRDFGPTSRWTWVPSGRTTATDALGR
jgi:ribosomal-protein-alanine N-acetyltransferase